MGANPVHEYEIARDCDLAVFRAEKPALKTLSWRTGELAMLAPVRAIGFSYALDAHRGAIHNPSAKRGDSDIPEL